MLLIIGAIFQLIGGFLLSIEALGIKEYIEYKNDGVEHHQIRANLFLNATLDNISVFLFVNIIWFLILLKMFKLPLKTSFLLFLIGYFVWKLIISISKQLCKIIYKLRFDLPKNAGCILTIVTFPYVILWVLVYATTQIISMIIEFSDMPVRWFSEKVISRCILYMFVKIYNLLRNMKNDVFKKPVFIGAMFIILGFIYQFLGILLAS